MEGEGEKQRWGMERTQERKGPARGTREVRERQRVAVRGSGMLLNWKRSFYTWDLGLAL